MITCNIDAAYEEHSRIVSLHKLKQEYDTELITIKTGIISGGFDPITPAHIRYIYGAIRFVDVLLIVVNGDSFLERKKGYFVQSAIDRALIVQSVYGPNNVLIYDEKDTMEDIITKFKPDFWINGGDRAGSNLSEAETKACEYVGCANITGVGGDVKTHSSRDVVERLYWNLLSAKTTKGDLINKYHGGKLG